MRIPIPALLMAVLAASLSACAPVAKCNVTDLSLSQSCMTVIDDRPQSERETKTFSLLATSCAFGIKRLGDETTSPDRVTLLRHRVYEKFKDEGLPKTLEVHSFVIYNNIKAFARTAGFQAGITGTMASKTSPLEKDFAEFFQSQNDATIKSWYESLESDECRPVEVNAANYAPEENPSDEPAFIVYIDASLDGQRTRVRHVEPYMNSFGSYAPYQAQAVEHAIEKFLN